MESKRELKKQKNRQSMIDATLQLFNEKPFTDVSVRDVTNLANVSPALVYRHFDDQHHLFLEAMQQENEKLLETLGQYDTIESLSKGYVQFMGQNHTLYHVIAHLTISSKEDHIAPAFFDEASKLFNLFLSKVACVTSDEEAYLETSLLFATLNGILITYKSLPQYTAEEAFDKSMELVDLYVQKFQKKS